MYWYLLLRNDQCTFGSLVLIEKNFFKKYSDLSEESHREKFCIIKEIESKGKDFLKFDKINYLMLMMVDLEVHVHVIPRYSTDKYYKKTIFSDPGWPGLPQLNFNNNMQRNVYQSLVLELRTIFS